MSSMMYTVENLIYSAIFILGRNENMIKVVDLGYQFVNVGGFDVTRPHGSGDYLFLFFRCTTEVWIDGRYQTIPENTYFLYKKGEPQIYRKKDGHFINDWIHFDIDPYDNFFEDLGIPFQTPMQLAYNNEICDMISNLFIEYFNIGKQHEEIMDQKARSLFYKFSDLYHFSKTKGDKMTDYRQTFIEIRRQIQNYEIFPTGAEEIAASLNISTSYAQHLYKELFGNSIHQDIIHARIEHAAHLLNGTEFSISEIARQCGYESFEHFSRQFKKLKGCSPRSYRSGSHSEISNR